MLNFRFGPQTAAGNSQILTTLRRMAACRLKAHAATAALGEACPPPLRLSPPMSSIQNNSFQAIAYTQYWALGSTGLRLRRQASRRQLYASTSGRFMLNGTLGPAETLGFSFGLSLFCQSHWWTGALDRKRLPQR